MKMQERLEVLDSRAQANEPVFSAIMRQAHKQFSGSQHSLESLKQLQSQAIFDNKFGGMLKHEQFLSEEQANSKVSGRIVTEPDQSTSEAVHKLSSVRIPGDKATLANNPSMRTEATKFIQSQNEDASKNFVARES